MNIAHKQNKPCLSIVIGSQYTANPTFKQIDNFMICMIYKLQELKMNGCSCGGGCRSGRGLEVLLTCIMMQVVSQNPYTLEG